ncbi:MAG: hypothetical protein AAB354_02950, partial [candidate division KSB1 bacterium]
IRESQLRILIDECTPHLVKKRLPQFAIKTAQEMGWGGIKNGKLFGLAEGQFNVLISTDQNLSHQQNLTGKQLAVIILPSNKVPIVAQLLPAIEQAINIIQPGTFFEIPLP